MTRSCCPHRRLVLLTTVSVLALFATAAQAQVKGLTLQAGQATVSTPSPTSTIIQQSSEKAILNWQNFSVPAGSSVAFAQPNSAAIALNRVVGPNPSGIFGNLAANGQIWLINPNGILFGHGSQINVGGLIATTSDIRDQDFLTGNYNFGIPSSNPNAAVVNGGTITTASGGSVVLAGARVDNQGLIEANLGSVVLAGAGGFTVDFQGDNLLSFQVGAPVTQSPTGRNGQPAAALVANAGVINTPGGKVLLTARAARNVLDNVINTTGIIEATTASESNGEIVLDAGPTGTASAGGVLDASGKGAGQTGGTIEVLGNQVGVAFGATLDVSGDAGGGTILVGGNFHGAGPQQNATETVVAQGAALDADALTAGNGGNVAVWSSGATSFAGTISARGGASGGNGGVVETSGTTLGVAASATVDASAPYGAPGSWLLDPANIIVASGGVSALTGGVLGLDQDPTLTDTIDPATIETALHGTDVTLQASQDITVNDGIGYISAFTLALMSEGTIHINAPIQNGGTGALDLIAGWNGTSALAAVLGSSLASGTFGSSGGDITIASPVANKVAAGNKIAVGSAQGTTTVDAENLTIDAINVDAQLGDDAVGAAGAIDVNLTGNLLVQGSSTASNAGALIGNGLLPGLQGSVSGDITIDAAGSVTLQGGPGPDGYAQIGNLGSDGNLTASTSVTGAIDISALSVALDAGSGTNSYAQIGNGRFLSTAATAGSSATALYGGDISVDATTTVSLEGNASGAFAQIGNGGEVNSLAAVGGGVTEQGDITVTAGAGINSGTLTLQGGSATNSYAQIGNGGSFLNSGQAQSGVAETGNIAVTASGATGTASLTGGSSSVPTAYAQIGNGDDGGENAGAASGAITLLASQVNETGNALVGNASANGSVTGGITVAAPVTIAGTVFADGGLTVLPDAVVGLLIDGTNEGSVTAGAGGAYDFNLAGNLFSSSGVDLLLYLLGGSTKGDTFYDDATGSLGGLDIYANYLRILSGKTTASAMVAGLGTALGSNSGANFLFTIGSGNALNLASGTNLEIDATAGALSLDQAIDTGSAALVLNSAGAVTQTEPLAAGGLALLGAGASYTLTDASNAVATIAADTGTVNLTNAGDLAVGSVGGISGVTASGAVTLATTGNLTLGSGVSGSAVTLATGGAFINDDGSGAVAVTGGGRWLVYSQNPANDTIGGLADDFLQYDAPYPTAPTPAAGDGFLYALSPVVTAVLTGTVAKVYDGTDAATLGAANYTLSGTVGGDTVTLNDPTSGTYAGADAGSGIAISVSGLAITGATNGAAAVYGYTLASPSAAADIGTITPAPVTAGLTGSVSKVYDGTTTAVLTPANYTLSGVVAGDSVTLNDPTVGTYAGPNAGAGIEVSVSGLTVSSPNYMLVSSTAAAAIGAITPAPVTVGLTGTVAKVYDGTTTAVLTPANYTLSGVVPGTTVTINDPTAGTYASAAAGTGIGVSVSGLAIAAAGGGATLGDYRLTSTGAAANIGMIGLASLTASLTGVVSKTYDGTTTAVLTPANYTLSGVVAGDQVTLNDPTVGIYSSANVGSGIGINVSGLALSSPDYILTSTTASANIGTITPAPLTYVANPASVVLGNALPSLTGTVTGFVAGETLLSATTGTLAFTTPATASSGAGLYAIDGSGLTANDGNYVFAQAAQNATALAISVPPPPPPSTPSLTPGEQGAIVSLLQSSVAGNTGTNAGAGGEASAGGAAAGQGAAAAPGALETLTNGGPGHASAPEPQNTTDAVTLALDKFKGLPAATQTIISGMLTQALPTGDNSPHGVPPADQDFSSWGNEAFWQ